LAYVLFHDEQSKYSPADCVKDLERLRQAVDPRHHLGLRVITVRTQQGPEYRTFDDPEDLRDAIADGAGIYNLSSPSLEFSA
jgi:hypothetical protein